MNTIISIFGIINLLLGVFSIPFCLMGGLMIFDAPGSTEKLSNHIVSYLFLTFPLVCFICGLLVYLYSNKYSIYISLFPIVEGTTFISILYVISLFERLK